ncbi:hypothetical protein EVAR_14715_1, partial [Eumeta japonica]
MWPSTEVVTTSQEVTTSDVTDDISITETVTTTVEVTSSEHVSTTTTEVITSTVAVTTEEEEKTTANPSTSEGSTTTAIITVTEGQTSIEVTSTTVQDSVTDEIGDTENLTTTENHITTENPTTVEIAPTTLYASTTETTDDISITEEVTTTDLPVTSTVEEVTATELETMTSSATTPASLCPSNFFGNIPHPELCDSYYLCTAGIANQLFCSEGNEFDPELSRCVEISDSGCTASRATADQSTVTESEGITVDSTIAEDNSNEEDKQFSSEATSKEEVTTEREITTEATTEKELCPIGHFGNVAHPELCDSFFMCTAGIANQLFCSEGNEFSPEEGRCVPISDSGCTVSQSSRTTTEVVTTIEDVTTSDVTEDISTTEIVTTTVAPSTDEHVTATPIEEITSTLSDVTVEEEETTTTQGTTTTEVITATEKSTTLEVTSTTEHGSVTEEINNTETIFTTENIVTTQEPTTTEVISTTIDISTTEITEGVTIPEEETATETTIASTVEEITVTESEATSPTATTAAPLCPSNFFGNRPHPELCNSYYLCTAGIANQLFCSDGNEFDPEEGRCVEISDSGCTASRTTADQSTVTEAEGITTASTVGEKNSNEEDEEFSSEDTSKEEVTTEREITTEVTTEKELCPIGHFGNVAHPELCDSFFMCTAGIANQLFCNEGNEFSPEEGRCVPISDSGCTAYQLSKTTTETITTETVTETVEASTDEHASVTTTEEISSTVSVTSEEEEKETTTSRTITTEGVATTREEEAATETPIASTVEEITVTESEATSPTATTAAPLCPSNFFGNRPHPELCNSYYLCTAGIANQLFCSDGNEFDPEEGRCVEISDSGCTASRLTTDQTTVTEDPSEGSTAEPTLEEETDKEGEEYLEADSTEKEAEVTTEREIAVEVTTEKELCPIGHFGNVAHPELCDSFFMCTAGIANQLFCSDGHEFSPEVNRCVEISDSGCTASRLTTAQSTVTEDSTEGNTDEPLLEGENGKEREDYLKTDSTMKEVEVTTEGDAAIEVTTEKELCPIGYFGNVAHPELCDSFYMCTAGIANQLFCNEGHEFDPNVH